MDRIDSLKNLILDTKVIDLTQPIHEKMPAAPGHNPYQHLLWNSPQRGDIATSFQIILNEHTGTHVDAPGHFVPEDLPDCLWIDQLPVKSFLCECKVIKKTNIKGGEYITLNDISTWENTHSPIKKGDGVLFYTGWDQLFMNCHEDGRYVESWPGLQEDSVDYLIKKGAAIVGIDTVSIDSSRSKDFPSHHKLLANQIPILENLNNLGLIDCRCFLMALPLPIKHGTASPVRAMAFIND